MKRHWAMICLSMQPPCAARGQEAATAPKLEARCLCEAEERNLGGAFPRWIWSGGGLGAGRQVGAYDAAGGKLRWRRKWATRRMAHHWPGHRAGGFLCAIMRRGRLGSLTRDRAGLANWQGNVVDQVRMTVKC